MKFGFKNIKNSLTKKMLVYFLIICTTVGIVFSTISYYSTKKYFLKVYFQLAHSCALDVANMMYDAPIDEFLKGKEKKAYNGYLRSIKNIAGCFGLKYIYIYIPQEKDKSLTLLYLIEGKTGKEFEEYKLGYVSEKDIVEPDVIDSPSMSSVHIRAGFCIPFGNAILGNEAYVAFTFSVMYFGLLRIMLGLNPNSSGLNPFA